MNPDNKTTVSKSDDLPAKPVAKKSRKSKRSVPHGQVHVFASFNNTIISITDNNGSVIAATSAGACGFRGSKKGTAYAAQVAVEKAAEEVKQVNNFRKADVFVKGIGQGRDAAIRSLIANGINIESLTDQTPDPHGGTRAKKVRRT